MSNRRKTTDIASMQFYKLDKWLLTEKSLKNLSPTAKMLYVIIKDREELSLKNAKAFTDKDGYLFQYFDQQKASDLLGVSLTAIKKAFKDLVEYKLIESVRQGLGKPNRLYVLDYEISEDTIKELSYTNKKASSTAIDEAPQTSTSINNLSNKSIPQKDKKDTKKYNKNYKPNRFHNCKNKVLEYTEEELNEILEENEKVKKEKRECKENNVSVDIRNVEELVKKALLSKEYFEALESEYKNIVVDYILNNNMFKPFYMDNI
jgi:hypothetical protein